MIYPMNNTMTKSLAALAWVMLFANVFLPTGVAFAEEGAPIVSEQVKSQEAEKTSNEQWEVSQTQTEATLQAENPAQQGGGETVSSHTSVSSQAQQENQEKKAEVDSVQTKVLDQIAEELPNQEISAEMIAKWGMNVEESSSSSTLVNYYSVYDDELIPLLMKENWTVDYKVTQGQYPDTVQWYLKEKSQVVDFWWEKVIFNKWGYPLFEKKDSIYRKALKNPRSVKDIPSSLSYDLEASLKGEWTSLDSFVKYAQVKNVKNQLVWYFLLTPQELPDFVYAPVAGEAKIGNQGFLTLQDAIDSANDGDTIVLTNDINLNTVISLSKNLTIDLNGKTITNNVPQWMMTVSSPVKLTLKGGKVIAPTANTNFWWFINVLDSAIGSEIVIDGGEYKGNTDDGSFFRFRWNDSESKTKVELNNLVAETNHRFVGTDNGHSIALKVNGGNYTLKEHNNTAGFFLMGARDAESVFTDVTINSEYRQPISVTRQKAVLKNCNITVENKSNSYSYLSSAVSVNANGQVIVEWGNYISKGYWLYVFNSGGKIVVKWGVVKGETKAIQLDLSLDPSKGEINSEVVVEDAQVEWDVLLNYWNGAGVIKLTIKWGDFQGKLEKGASNKTQIAISGGTFPKDVAEYAVDAKCSIKNADSKYEVKDCPVATKFYGSSNVNYVPVALDGETIKLNETHALIRKVTGMSPEMTTVHDKILEFTDTTNLLEIKEVAGEKLLFVNVAEDWKNQTKVFRAKNDGIFWAEVFKSAGALTTTDSITPDLDHAIVPSWVNKNHSIKAYHEITKDGKVIGYTLQTAKPDYWRFYAPKKYTITFDSNGGSKVEKITQGYGTAVTAPANPTRSCHRFKWWSSDIPATMPAENTTLKAQWSSNTCGGGGWGGSSSSVSSSSVTTWTTSSVNTWANQPVKPKVEVRNYSWDALPSLCSAEGSSFSEEQNHAYLWACGKDITTIRAISGARLDQPLTRAELAKMMSVYVTKVLGKQPVLTGVAQYPDVDSKMGDLADYIQLAYQLQIMGIHHDGTALSHFEPNKFVTRAEFATVFSRVLYGAKYNQDGKDWANGHLNALKEAGILKNITPNMLELRGRVLLMLQRSTVAK